ncbi:MAG: tripartite tricarboxylate transporter permease, partial [Bilophila wadsworthia]
AVPIDCRTIVFPLLSEWKGRFVGLLRSSGIGILIGILPGTGPTAATFISYASAKRSSKNGANFGKGEPDGLIAAESANNAVTGGALVPTLALGIPGDATLALLLATFAIHNLTPGVRLMVDFPDVVYASFITLVIANLMLIPSAILTVRLFGTLMRIPSPLFIGFILLLSLLGAFISRNLSFDLSVAIVMGLVGFAMRLWDFPAAAMLIGFVLGPQFEYRLGQVFLFKGELSWLEYFSQNPVGTGLLVITAFILLSPIYSALRRKGGDAATPDAASSEE